MCSLQRQSETIPTRLVVPATNFTAAIPNLGYRGIHQFFDKEKINYTRKTIIEAAHLKTELETRDRVVFFERGTIDGNKVMTK